MLKRLSRRLSKDSTELATSKGPALGGDASGNDDLDSNQAAEFLEGDSDAERVGLAQTSEVGPWLQHVSKATLKADVSDEVEQKRTFVMRKKNVFTVRVKDIESNDIFFSKRTFGDFKRFQGALRDRFDGVLVPPLPKKPIVPVGKMVEQLDLFVREVAANPFLRADAAFEMFALKNAKKFNETVVTNLAKETDGSKHWKEVVDCVPLPRSCSGFLRDLAREATALQGLYGRLRDHVKKVQGHIRRQAKDQNEMTAFFDRWTQREAKEFHHLFGQASDPTSSWDVEADSISMPLLLGNLRAISERRAETLDNEAERLVDELLKVVHLELVYLQEFERTVVEVRAAFKKHLGLMSNLQGVKAKLDANVRKSLALTVPGTIGAASAVSAGAARSDGTDPAHAGGIPVAQGVSHEDVQSGGVNDANGPLGSPGFGSHEFAPTAAASPSSSHLPSPGREWLPKNHVKMEQKSAEMEDEVRTSQLQVKRLIRGLIFETNRYRFERTARAAAMLNSLAQIQEANLKSVLEVCATALRRVPASVPPVSHLACFVGLPDPVQEVGAPAPAVAERMRPDSPLVLSPRGSVGSVGSARFDDRMSPGSPEQRLSMDGQASKRTSLRVRYDFEAEGQGEVTLRRGDLVEIVQADAPDEGDGWCRVVTGDGREGLAPAAYLDQAGMGDSAVASPTSSVGSGYSSRAESPVARAFQPLSYDLNGDPIESANSKFEAGAGEGAYHSSFAAPVAEPATPPSAEGASARPVGLLSSIQGFDRSKLGGSSRVL